MYTSTGLPYWDEMDLSHICAVCLSEAFVVYLDRWRRLISIKAALSCHCFDTDLQGEEIGASVCRMVAELGLSVAGAAYLAVVGPCVLPR